MLHYDKLKAVVTYASFLFPYLSGPHSRRHELSVNVTSHVECSLNAAKLSQNLFQ